MSHQSLSYLRNSQKEGALCSLSWYCGFLAMTAVTERSAVMQCKGLQCNSRPYKAEYIIKSSWNVDLTIHLHQIRTLRIR
jgi:hypothetical protein